MFTAGTRSHHTLFFVALFACAQKLGVEKQGPFVKVNNHLQTNVKGLWAIGDCVPGPMLAHKSEEEGDHLIIVLSLVIMCVTPVVARIGIAVIENIKNNSGHVNYNAIP